MSFDARPLRALCFDVDGTLSDTDDVFVQRLAGWLSPLRLVMPEARLRTLARRVVMATETPGTFLFGLPDRLGVDDEIASVADALYRLGLGKSVHPFSLIPGVVEMLQQLGPRFPMSIVSARGERTTLAFLDQFNLRGYFSAVITSQSCRRTKPHPEPILKAAQQMGVPVQACLMVGDTTVDMRAAQAAGAQAVGVLCGFGERDELLRSGASHILPSTPDLTNLLVSQGGFGIE